MSDDRGKIRLAQIKCAARAMTDLPIPDGSAFERLSETHVQSVTLASGRRMLVTMTAYLRLEPETGDYARTGGVCGCAERCAGPGPGEYCKGLMP